VGEQKFEVDFSQALAEAAGEELSRRLGRQVLLTEPRYSRLARTIIYSVVDETDTVVGQATVKVRGTTAEVKFRPKP